MTMMITIQETPSEELKATKFMEEYAAVSSQEDVEVYNKAMDKWAKTAVASYIIPPSPEALTKIDESADFMIQVQSMSKFLWLFDDGSIAAVTRGGKGMAVGGPMAMAMNWWRNAEPEMEVSLDKQQKAHEKGTSATVHQLKPKEKSNE